MTHAYDAGPASADEAALFEVADLARDVVDATVHTAAPPEVLAEAAGLLRRAADLLRSRTRSIDAFHSPRYNAVSGLANPVALPVLPTPVGDGLRAEVTFRQAYEGPPGYAHGGMIAAVLDQMLGYANGLAGAPGMTARFTVSYRRPTPLCRPVVVTSRHSGSEGRKSHAEGRIEVDGRTAVEAEGLFIAPTNDQRWERFHGARSEADDL